jgi:hypothetical protein
MFRPFFRLAANRCLCAAIAGLVLLSGASAQAAALPETRAAETGAGAERLALNRRVFDTVWREVQRSYYDPNLHGVDWRAARETWRPVALAAPDDRQLYLAMNAMLDLLDDDHAAASPAASVRRRASQRSYVDSANATATSVAAAARADSAVSIEGGVHHRRVRGYDQPRSGVVLKLMPTTCFSEKMSQRRKSTCSWPSASSAACPVTRPSALITRQELNVGTVPKLGIFSMKDARSSGMNRPERSRSLRTTAATWAAVCWSRALAPKKSVMAIGMG